MLFNNLKTGINLVSKRFARQKLIKCWPNDFVPFHWSRPETKPGYIDDDDLTGYDRPSVEDLDPQFRLSTELHNLDANHPARKVFSLAHVADPRLKKLRIDQNIERLGLIHHLDYKNSMEAKIISLTFCRRHMFNRLEIVPSRLNGGMRTAANNMKMRRTRWLCTLKELHSDRYERLLKQLGLEGPDNPINPVRFRNYRKNHLRVLTKEYCQKLREQKVQEFQDTLKAEQEAFEEEKVSTLKWIEESEKKLADYERKIKAV